MTILRTALATSTALVFGLSAAWADNNDSFLTQSGTDNTASIDQSSGSDNTVGLSGQPALQDGTRNDLDILQVGDSNAVGTGALGLRQLDDDNVASITQNNDNNLVSRVTQDHVNGGTDTQNVLIINQGTAGSGAGGNSVLNILQERRGAPASNATENRIVINQSGVTGFGNRVGQNLQRGYNQLITIDQVGSNNNIENAVQTSATNVGTDNQFDFNQTGTSNTVRTVTQSGAGHRMTITQNGTSNWVESGTGQYGLGNTATLTFMGDRNGDRFADFTSGGDAAAIGLVRATSFQDNSGGGSVGNSISYMVTGNDNLFAFRQIGDANDISGQVSSSDFNEVAVAQMGDGNVAGFLQTGGGGNIIGISQ